MIDCRETENSDDNEMDTVRLEITTLRLKLAAEQNVFSKINSGSEVRCDERRGEEKRK